MPARNVRTDENALRHFVQRTTDRLRKLEARPDGQSGASHDLPLTLGGYTLSEGPNGNLLATNDTTGTVTVVATP